MEKPPYDQRIARVLVRPLARAPVSPNHLTGLSLALALAGAGLLAQGDTITTNWGVGLFVNLALDKEAGLADGDAVGYPGFAGFELEDDIYLIAPITWLGWLAPFFVASGIGAAIYCLWTSWTLAAARARRRG